MEEAPPVTRPVEPPVRDRRGSAHRGGPEPAVQDGAAQQQRRARREGGRRLVRAGVGEEAMEPLCGRTCPGAPGFGWATGGAGGRGAGLSGWCGCQGLAPEVVADSFPADALPSPTTVTELPLTLTGRSTGS